MGKNKEEQIEKRKKNHYVDFRICTQKMTKSLKHFTGSLHQA